MSDEQSIISHLLELRDRLLRIVVVVIGVFVVLFFYPGANKLYTLLAHPLLMNLPKGGQMIATEVTTPFFVPMKVAAMAAFLISLPYVLYQLWGFIAPGLYAHEKRFALPVVISGTVLFFVGMAFAYFVVFPVVFGFITHTAPQGVAVMTDISKYLDFVLTLFMAFGITFEVPVVVVLLVKMGLVSVAKLKEIRPYMIVGAFVVGAIFTPPDVVSQFMLAMPLWLLYELGILVSGFVSKPAEAEAYQPLSEAEMDAELDRADAAEKPEPK
ncbi:MAG: twin-arginine translocase subunit TatC [Burkholderiales bacterium]